MDTNKIYETLDAVQYDNHLKQVESACYPPIVEEFPVISLQQFLLYLPLLPPEEVVDILLRILSGFAGHECYALGLINRAVSLLPDTPAKKYADRCAATLTRDSYLRGEHRRDVVSEDPEGYLAYRDVLKKHESFMANSRRINK